MTAIDIAVQSKALGAEEVTMVYRRGQENMNASRYEQEFAQTRGVTLRHWSKPRKLLDRERTRTRRRVRIDAAGKDGNSKAPDRRTCSRPTWCSRPSARRCCGTRSPIPREIVELKQDRIVVDEERRTSLPGVWAGGDCVFGGEDLTVSAVQDGKVAALSIDRFLRAGAREMTWPI